MLKRLCRALAVGAALVAQAGASELRIVAFEPSVPAAERLRLVRARGARVLRELPLIAAVSAELPSGTAPALDLSLQSIPGVLRVEEDFRQIWIRDSHPALQEARREIAEALHGWRFRPRPSLPAPDPRVPWGVARVNAPAAWGRARGAGVKVAVIDTGIDRTHPNLSPNIKGGRNLIANAKPEAFDDDQGHGTHVSGTIAAAALSTGPVGVAPEAWLYGVKVLDQWGGGTFADVIAGIQWAAENRMDVVNMSLGASFAPESLRAAVQAAVRAGLVVVAAAGNSGGSVGVPASYPEVIAVSASDSANKLADFSSRGPQVAFIAPGVDVLSTAMGGGTTTMDGTSMACPHVAGLAALAISASGVRGAEAVRAALRRAAVPLPGLKPPEQGAGLVDAAKLVK